MIQRFSVQALFFSILVSAENSTPVSNNALSHKPVIMDNDYSAIKIKTIFLNKKLFDFDSNVHNSNRTKKVNLLKVSRMNYIAPISGPLKGTKLRNFSQNTRFPRQADNINSYKNIKEDTADRYIKILLDLQSENDDNMYDYYDYKKYHHDNQEKHINSLMEDRNLNKEIENSSKLLTRNLSESQERKRCTKNNMENISPRKLQLSQPLTLENIKDEKKSNMGSAELKNNFNRNSGLKRKNDDYFINILNQLIDKLNKSKDLKTTHDKDLLERKSNEQISLENKSIEERTTNSSSEEELILRLEKIKGNRLLNKLNSSPETTFVNGKWIRNKILENKNNNFKPVDLRSEFNYTEEPILINDSTRFNLTYPENQVTDTKGDIPNNLNNLQVFGTQENKEMSTSPLPEENEHFLFSRATTNKPIYLTSTIEDKLDSTMVDENDTLKLTTNHIDEFHNDDNNTNHDKSYESTLNNFHTTPNYETNKDLFLHLNNLLKTKKPEKILDSSVSENNKIPKSNYSEEITTIGDLSLAERENDSSENNGYCNCNKKIVKNILSSTMIQNVTEIKTDSYVSPNLKMNGYKRSDKLQKTKNNSKNITSSGVLNKNKNDLISNLLLKNQMTNERLTKRKLQEPKVNTLQKSTLDLDDKTNKNMKTIENIFLHNFIIPKTKIQQLQLNDQKKRNSEEKTNKVVGIQKTKTSLISKNLQNKNPRQFVVPPKQYIPKHDDYVRSNIEGYNNVDEINGNQRVSNLPKKLNKMPNEITSRTPSRSLARSFKENASHESSTKRYIENFITKLKHNVPVNYKEANIPRNIGGYYNIDDTTMVKKSSNSPISLLPTPTKIINKPSPTLMSKYLEKVPDGDVNITKNKPRKLTTESYKYVKFNQNPFTNNTQRKNINKDYPKINKIINSLDLVKSRKPLNLVGNNDRNKMKSIPKYRHNNIGNVYSTDIPTNNEISNKYNTGINNKVSKVDSLPGTRLMLNNERNSTLKLRKPFLKKQSTVNNQLKTESLFDQKTDSTKNSRFQNDADLNVSFKPKVLKISHEDSSRDNVEHAPYKYEDLEPIIFDQLMNKPVSVQNPESVYRSSPSWLSEQENQLQNIQGFEPLHSVSIIRPEYDDYYNTQKSNKGKTNIEKHQYQPDTLNNEPANDDNIEYNGYFLRGSKQKPINQSRFEVLPRIKVDDGMFKIPLVSHTSFNKNGSSYISDIYVPIEKPNGQHSALSLSELLTGDFHYVNEHGERPLNVEHTLEANPPLSSARIPKDGTGSYVADQSCDPTILKALKPSDDKQTAPIHIIQIINNGQCADKHADNGTVKKPEHNDEVSFRKLRNRDQRVSVARSSDIINSKQIKRKLGNAYDHFDSDILDRFLQVYAPLPPIV